MIKNHKQADYCKRFLLAMELGEYNLAQSLAYDLQRIDNYEDIIKYADPLKDQKINPNLNYLNLISGDMIAVEPYKGMYNKKPWPSFDEFKANYDIVERLPFIEKHLYKLERPKASPTITVNDGFGNTPTQRNVMNIMMIILMVMFVITAMILIWYIFATKINPAISNGI